MHEKIIQLYNAIIDEINRRCEALKTDPIIYNNSKKLEIINLIQEKFSFLAVIAKDYALEIIGRNSTRKLEFSELESVKNSFYPDINKVVSNEIILLFTSSMGIHISNMIGELKLFIQNMMVYKNGYKYKILKSIYKTLLFFLEIFTLHIYELEINESSCKYTIFVTNDMIHTNFAKKLDEQLSIAKTILKDSASKCNVYVDFELIRKYNWTYEDTKIINEHAQVFNLICILNGFAVDFKESDVLFSKNIQIHNKVS